MPLDTAKADEAHELVAEAKAFAIALGAALHAGSTTSAQDGEIFAAMIEAYVEERYKRGDIHTSGYRVFLAAAKMEPPCGFKALPSAERLKRRDELDEAIDAFSFVSAEEIAADRADHLNDCARENAA